mmetsp:Transcript_27565/g.58248  ORF Transcript_27565/g.58248 Transcript_27565/m.58248 type:complete len:485 (+) Transcript_27565:97-1551(+)|eukprot:CAMPEP_0183720758 /NCGR_PEP_ID=MMETSP0737-20130205/13283_1 /TAXON_ID=385413 /ORGANISM="Thalassiosira miniscula, Strain CCMP1093" /LENGTH=484 /DNA_ID=CAMNT_0025950679 /DNA_START=44 /DNA_END=1498 /DNA_ORIENTATION=+
MSSLAQIKKLSERYPFDESELEQLIRCHAALLDVKNADTFLTKIALSSPYSYFFLPGNEMRRRIELIEDKILPFGFGSCLRAATSVDLFVDCANEGDLSLERFLEGIADCGQRGHKEALKIIWDCCSYIVEFEDKLNPSRIIDMCYRLAFAAEVIVSADADADAIVARLSSEHDSACSSLERSLAQAGEDGLVTKQNFYDWAETMAPQISSTLSTFMHNLLFHGKMLKHRLNFVPFEPPKLDQRSDIFEGVHPPNMFALTCTSPLIGGKWHNLYSFEFHGHSMNRLQYSILGYCGPTVIVIETEQGHILGGFFTTTWKKAASYGDSNAFLFQLSPTLTVFNPTGDDTNFIHLQDGLGFGGTKDMPRLFIPASMEACNAGVMDKTFRTGNLLPEEALEKFNIKSLEVWGCGGEDVVKNGLKAREETRELVNAAIGNARKIKDKRAFVEDINLLETSLYKHREEARGRAEFKVDDKHGGYMLERGQ